MFYSIFINSQVEKTALIRGVLQNQNYSKLRAKVFCTTKIVVYYTKLPKIIYLERRLFLRQWSSIQLSIKVNSGLLE